MDIIVHFRIGYAVMYCMAFLRIDMSRKQTGKSIVAFLKWSITSDSVKREYTVSAWYMCKTMASC